MVITNSYEDITNGYNKVRKEVGTIGLDWLGRGWREVSLVVER